MVVYSNGMRYQTSGKHAWWTTTWSYLSLADQKKASKMISSIFAGVSKGKYKLGSTGNRGG